MIPHSAPWITAEDRAAVDRCLASGQIASGALASRFEDDVARQAGARFVRSAPDGTAALTCALRLLGVEPGDEVVLPTYVCIDVERAIRAVGAQPRFADVGPDGTLTTGTVEQAVTDRTRAIIAVHTFGHICDIAPLRAFGVPVVEDACQAFAFETAAGRAGTLGDIGVYSFHATKCLTTGEGGMIVSNTVDVADLGDTQDAPLPALSDLQAALGLAQLSRYDTFVARRASIRAAYEAAIAQRATSTARLAATHLFRFTVPLRQGTTFDAAAAYFEHRGIALRRGVDALLHRAHGLPDSDFPQAADLFARNASVPFYPALSDEQVNVVALALAEYDGVA